MVVRSCSRVSCDSSAEYTLSYVYADQMVVIGPLSPQVDPHSYDLCPDCSETLTAPRGWTVMRPRSVEPQPPAEPAWASVLLGGTEK